MTSDGDRNVGSGGLGAPEDWNLRSDPRYLARQNATVKKKEASFDDYDKEEWGNTSGKWGSRYVFKESSQIRACWSLIVAVMLIYTGTFFPYRLCFLEFRIDGPWPIPEYWKNMDAGMDALFWVDLVSIFFFSYTDDTGTEILDMRIIARRYLCGWFVINLLCCVPAAAFNDIGDGNVAINKGFRLARLHRVGRLFRLARLLKIFEQLSLVRETYVWRLIQSSRGIRMMNFMVGLFWVVHIMACGWALAGSVNPDASESWVARRVISKNGTLLIDQRPFDQWLHSMYFILTIFTTVGFGDMFAVSSYEIVYVCFTMMVGTVAHSIIMSEVISVLTSVDRRHAELHMDVALIKDFGRHAKLNQKIVGLMNQCAKSGFKHAGVKPFMAEEMKTLLSGGLFSRVLLQQLPSELFHGLLVKNQLFQGVAGSLPPRLILVLAAVCREKHYGRFEVVYHTGDLVISMYLVLTGCFAYIGQPHPEGGRERASVVTGIFANSEPIVDSPSGAPASERELSPYKLFGPRSYFGEEPQADHGGTGVGRQASATCESDAGGVVLAVQISEMSKLAEDFPSFGRAWARESVRREWHRVNLLQRLTRPRPYKLLAAETLQEFVRESYLKHRSVSTSYCASPKESSGVRSVRKVASPKDGSKEPAYAQRLRKDVEALGERVAGLQGSMDMILQEIRAQRVGEVMSRC